MLSVLPPPPEPLSPPPPHGRPPSPQSVSKGSAGLMIGIVAGLFTIGVAMLIAIFVLLYRRRRRSRLRYSFHEHYIIGLIFDLSPPPTDERHNIPFPHHMKTITCHCQAPVPSLPTHAPDHAESGSAKPSRNVETPPFPSILMPTAGARPIKYEDLRFATEGFSRCNVLGEGNLGLVYLGRLDGKKVAIKRLCGERLRDEEFRAMVKKITQVNHRNVVPLVGYCIHEQQRFFVCDFVPNKTLDFHLHGSGRPTLDWHRRWKIALGCAKGLAYLHGDKEVIHQNIKATNVLLDYNFEPKVADFGLAMFQPAINMDHTRDMETFFRNMRLGYLAPQDVMSGELTDRLDVYSYGVILLELITGRKPIMVPDSRMDPLLNPTLVDWARPLLARAVTQEIYDELIDPRLESNYDPYNMARLIHCAAAAVRTKARMRPRMSQIVRYLEGEISLEDLNAGTRVPGNINVKANSAEEAALRRMASGGITNDDYTKSDRTTEYKPTASSSACTEGMEMEEHPLSKTENEGRSAN